MPYSDIEIQDKANRMVDAGASEEEVRSFIDAAKREATPAVAPEEPGIVAQSWEGAKKIANDMIELAPTPKEAAGATFSWENLLMPGVGQWVRLIRNKPKRLDYAAEVALPLAVQIATIEGTPALQAAAGGAAAFVGNGLAQLRRVASGEQKDFEWGQSAQNTALGALPFIGPAKLAGLAGIAERGAKLAAVPAAAAATTAVRTWIDEGRLPTEEELAFAAGLPLALHVTSLPVGYAGRKVSQKLGKMAEKEARMHAEGVQPTLGTLDRGYALGENIIAEKGGLGSDVATSIEDMHKGMKAYLADTSTPKTQIFDMGSEYYGAYDAAKEARDALSQQAKEAQAASREAQTNLLSLQARVGKDAQEQLKNLAEEAANKDLIATTSSVVQNGVEILQKQIQGDVELLNPAVAADRIYSRVITPLMEKKLDPATGRAIGAYPRYFNDKYSKFDPTIAVYEVDPILAKVAELEKYIPDGQPSDLGAAISYVKKTLPTVDDTGKSLPRSLGTLRDLREDLYGRAKGNVQGNQRAHITELARSVSDLINDGAKAASVKAAEFGKTWDAAELVATNAAYKRFRDILDLPGVSEFLDPTTARLTVDKALAEMEKSGKQGETFKNLTALIDYANELTPQLGETLRQSRNEVFKGALFSNLRKKGAFDHVTGRYGVDPSELADWMTRMEDVSEGTLKDLGLGDRGTASALKQLADYYPHASKPTADELGAIFRNPVFQASLEAQGQGGATPKDVLNHFLGKQMADSQLQNMANMTANLAAVGKLDVAKGLWAEARARVAKTGGDLAKADAKLVELGDDPLKVAFSSNGLNPKSYDDLARTLWDTDNFSDDLVQRFVDAAKKTEGGENFLMEIRAREIADFFADENVASPSFVATPTIPNYQEIAKFHQGDAAMEPIRRRAKILLGDEGFQLLDERSRMARDLLEYQKATRAKSENVAGRVPANSITRKAIGLIESLVKEGEYRAAAWVLLDPEKRLSQTAKALQKTGEVAAQVGTEKTVPIRNALVKGAVSLPYSEPVEEPQSQQEQPPAEEPVLDLSLLQRLRASRQEPTE